MSSTPIFDQTQVQFTAIAISLVTGQAFLLSIDRFETSKREDSSAGTFSCSGPFQQGSNAAYASVMSPMDIVAIYAARSSQLDGTSAKLGPPNTGISTAAQGPLLSLLTYGQPGGMAQQLDSPSCVFVGMLAVGGGDTSVPNSALELTGTDLTKVFMANDTFIPWDSNAAALWSGAAQLSLPGQTSTEILLLLFDIWIAKNPAALNAAISSNQTNVRVPNGGFAPTPVVTKGDATVAQFASAYGYPWRNFIDISKLNQNAGSSGFLVITSDRTYPPYLVQQGNSWANAMEIKNAPLTRLFVNEAGQLIHDDQADAWITQDIKAEVYGDEILSFRPTVDDADLMTFVSVYGNQYTNRGASAQVLGSLDATTTFDPGQAIPSLLNQNAIKLYGLRQTQFNSLYDSTKEQVRTRQSVLTLKYNILSRARAVIRGTTKFRVGDRVTFFAPGFNPATTNATWYVESMNQSADFEQETWTTTVDLMYPTRPNDQIARPQARA